MTELTNAAILLAASEFDVSCGGCRTKALPATVIGFVEHRESDIFIPFAIVQYRCETPGCVIGAGPGVLVEVPL
jgi:hypothetical protein